MRVTLIKPNMGVLSGGNRYIDTGRMEPLQLGVLAGMTPRSIDIRLFDDRCEDIPYNLSTDLVAITVETFTAKRAYEIAAEYRKLKVPVILGGFHPTLYPDESSEHADSIVIGDAESVWRDILDDVASGRLKTCYKSQGANPQAGGILPRRDLFLGKGYLPITLVQFGRGCQNGCDYCAISAYSQRQHTYRSINDVVQEIKAQNRKFIFFVDDNIVANKEVAKELFRALIKLKIKWVSQGTIDMVDDPKLMKLMKQSGCLGHVIGFETLDPRNLKASGKPNKINIASEYDKQINILKSYGLQIWAAFTLGYDYDTPDSLYSILEFSLRHKFTFAAYNILMPYPGTVFYQRLKAEKRLLYDGKWWLHPDYRFNHASFVPALMTAGDLTEISFSIRKQWNSPLSFVKRLLDIRTNLRSLSSAVLFWSYNNIFRSEVFKKQNMSFGYFK
ncbi:MAG: B12-binding domain-containing radical SAM protein [Candidatus Omnitrophica bacterium]|nr:B12-binding domain-containing radical SAM protein [Candidatus Omnitrophota bacterium]